MDWALLSLTVYQIKFVLMPNMYSEFRDALGLLRLRTKCPGDRYGTCRKWRKVHIYCLCSRGFDEVAKQLSENLLVFTDKVLEKKRFMIESILRFRYQSFFKVINEYYDISVDHENAGDHLNPCVQCFKYNMFMRYYEKQLELEFANSQYFDKYLYTIDRGKPLDQRTLKFAFIDWHLIANLQDVKRKEQGDDRRKKLKEEMDSREEQLFVLVNQ